MSGRTAAAPAFGPRLLGWLQLQIIARRELGEMVSSLRLQVIAGGILLLMALSAYSFSLQHLTEQRAYDAELAAYAERLEGRTLEQAAELRHPAIPPPWRLAFLVDAHRGAIPEIYEQSLSPWVAPRLAQLRTANHRLDRPARLDWLSLFSAVLPLATFILLHDAVCAPRNDGTLKLLLSYPVSHWQLLGGKLLAATVSLGTTVAAGALISLAVLGTVAELHLSAAEWTKVGLLVLVGLCALALYTLLALLVSTVAREPATSLVFLALLWIAGTVVAPAIADLVAERVLPLPGRQEQRQELERRNAALRERYGARANRWRDRDAARLDNFSWERLSAQAENERAEAEAELHRELLRLRLAQVELAGHLTAVSPTGLVEGIGTRLTGAGVYRQRALLAQAVAFRAVLARRFTELDAADPESPHILFIPTFMSQRQVAVDQIPRFTFEERSVGAGYAAAAPWAAVLIAEAVLLALATGLASLRQKVG